MCVKEMSGGEAVYEALQALGVEHVFGIVSVHNIPIYDVIAQRGGIAAICMRHEQAAIHAADGYARATGKLGVTITSTGPGAANGIPGLFEAQFASSRVLTITGQIETQFYGKGKGFLHEAEKQLEMLRTVAPHTESIRRTEDIADTIVRVAKAVSTGRPQPGAVEIPIDLQYGRADVDVPHVEGWPRPQPNRDAMAQASALLRESNRTVIWAGGGVINANAATELTQLAESLNAPVFTSINGRGAIPEDHPLALGPLANMPNFTEVVQGAEVILAVGTRFQAGATRNWQMQLGGKLVHIDADPGVIGRNYRTDVAVVGDARLALAGLLKDLEGAGNEPEFTDGARTIRDAAREQIRKEIGPDYAAIMDIIREYLPRDSAVVRDATVPAYLWGNRLLEIYEPRTSMHPTSAAIGPGLPLGIGAAVGTGKKAVVIQGDGGFMLSIGELASCAQHDVPVVICVFNDQGYGVLRTIEARTFEGRQFGVDLATPDFAMVAKGMGIEGEQVKGVDQFRDAFKRAVEAPGPVLLDIDMTVLKPMAGLGSPPPRKQ
jgi:acetolactate synthase I/II/III large subunit